MEAARYEFTNEQMERYSRHIILKDVGVKRAKKLLESKVLIIGTGGLGAPAAMFLAAAGVGTIGLVDLTRWSFQSSKTDYSPYQRCGKTQSYIGERKPSMK